MIGMLMRETGWVLAIWLTLGFAGAVLSTRVLATLLFGLSPTDPATIAVAALLLIAAASFAAYIPSCRASRVDPLVALRHE